MTIGQIYYLATICGKLYDFLFFMKFPLTIGAGIAVASYVAIKMDAFTDKDFFSDEIALAKKYEVDCYTTCACDYNFYVRAK